MSPGTETDEAVRATMTTVRGVLPWRAVGAAPMAGFFEPLAGAATVLAGSLAVAVWGSATAMSFRRPGEPVEPGGSERGVAEQPDFLWSLQRELDRSRRHGRPFVLIRVPLRANQAAERRRRKRRDAPISTGGPDELEPVLRNTDLAWTTETDLYLLLPESDRPHGRICLDRLRRRAPELLDDSAARVVAFPDDGVTSGALLDLLSGEKTEITAELPFFVPAGALLEKQAASGATA